MSARDLRLWLNPDRVREQGTTPDYRASLANERTFLAWLRTALAMVGGGLAVDQFLPDLTPAVRVSVAVALIVAGAACGVRAMHHWLRCELAMRRGEDLPVTRFPMLLAVVVAVAAVVLGVVALGAG